METLKMVAQCVQSIINFKFKFNEHNFFYQKEKKIQIRWQLFHLNVAPIMEWILRQRNGFYL